MITTILIKRRPVCDLVMLVLVTLGVPVSLYGLVGREGGREGV